MPIPNRIARLSDLKLADVAIELRDCLADSRANLFLYGGTSISADAALDGMTNKSYAIERAEIFSPNGGRYIDICRGKFVSKDGCDRHKFLAHRESSLFDEYFISFNDGHFVKEEIFQIEKILRPYRADARIEGGGNEQIDVSRNEIFRPRLFVTSKKIWLERPMRRV